MRHENRWPKEVVDAPYLDVFKAKLDGAGLVEDAPAQGWWFRFT